MRRFLLLLSLTLLTSTAASAVALRFAPARRSGFGQRREAAVQTALSRHH